MSLTARDHLINRIADIEFDLRHKIFSESKRRELQAERQSKLNELRRMVGQESAEEEKTAGGTPALPGGAA